LSSSAAASGEHVISAQCTSELKGNALPLQDAHGAVGENLRNGDSGRIRPQPRLLLGSWGSPRWLGDGQPRLRVHSSCADTPVPGGGMTES